MKTIMVVGAVLLLIVGAIVWRSCKPPDQYGLFVGAPHAEVADLINRPSDYTKTTVAIDGIVRKQCVTMGCYFYFESQSRELRVDLADIAMNAPRRNGHKAHVEGRMVPYPDGYQFSASAVEFD